MNRKVASLSMKIFVLYVHREYSTYEIAKLLGVSNRTVAFHLKRAEKTNVHLAALIKKQRKLNMLNARSKQEEMKIGEEINKW